MPKRPYTKPHLKMLPEEAVNARITAELAEQVLDHVRPEIVRLRASQGLWISFWGFLILIAVVVY